MHILIVEDDKNLANNLKNILEKERYICDLALSKESGFNALFAKNYDIALFDWMLPDGSGYELLKEIRDEKLNLPIIILTAKNEIDLKIDALDSGADDYITKPFSNRELLARIRALLRRKSNEITNKITIKNITLDLQKREVLKDNIAINLTNKEFELLEYLIINKNLILTRTQISEYISKELEFGFSSNVVDVHIKNIRKKLNSDIIETIRGIGFIVREG